MDFSEFAAPSTEWLSFIEANPAAARDGFSDNEISKAAHLRAVSNQARGASGKKLIAESRLHEKVAISTIDVPSRGSHTIPLRIYHPTSATADQLLLGAVLYFHGGGYLLGDETSDDYLCCRIAHENQLVVLSAIYRHTDKHQHPAQVDDAWDVFQYIRENAGKLSPAIVRSLNVLGISAGCTLAAGVVLRELEQSRITAGYRRLIKGCVMGIPWLIHIDNYPFHLFKTADVSAKVQNRETPVIPSERLQMFSDLLGATDPKDRLLNIPLLNEEELEGWPATALLVAGADPLRDDGLLFVKKLDNLGVPTKVHVYPGLPHGFRRWASLRATTDFDATLMESLSWISVKDKAIKQKWDIFES